MRLDKFLPPDPVRSKKFYFDQERRNPMDPRFYLCGICGAYHPSTWDGDCREDAARFDVEELDAEFGSNGWEEVPMPGGEDDA